MLHTFLRNSKFLITFFILVCTSLIHTSSFAQIDSLLKELKLCKGDTNKVNLLNELSYYYLFEDVATAKSYGVKALDLSTKINFERGIMRSYGQLGNIYNAEEKYGEAIESYLNGLRLATKQNNMNAKSSFSHNIGLLYLKLNQFEESKEYIQNSIELDKVIGDRNSIAISYNSLGSLYKKQKNNDKALHYFNEALKYVNKQNPSIEDATVYANLGTMYKEEGRYQLSQDFYKKAIEIYHGYDSPMNEAKNLVSLAEVERQFKHYDKALINYEKALKIVPDLHMQTALDFDPKNIFIGMAECYMKLNDFKNAALSYSKLVENFNLAIDNADSLKLIETEKAFAEMATKYESDKKDAALRESKLETKAEKEANEKKNIILYSLLGGGVLLILTLIIVFRSYRISKAQTRKINLQKNQIEKQHDEIVHINKEITASIEYAKNIQNSILPDSGTISRALPNHFVLWLPRDIVSGDFYWFHEDDEYVYFAAADCTGHGVPGAFVSVSCVNILNQVVIDEKFKDPGQILSRVHQHVCDIFRKKDAELKSNDGMDISLCRLDRKNNEMLFSGAMNPMVKIANGEIEEYKADRTAIGGRTPYDYQFSSKKVNFKPTDTFYMYSDGFKDQFGGPEGKKYLNRRFLQFLLKMSSYPMENQRNGLNQELTDWCGNYARIDDVLVVGFKPV